MFNYYCLLVFIFVPLLQHLGIEIDRVSFYHIEQMLKFIIVYYTFVASMFWCILLLLFLFIDRDIYPVTSWITTENQIDKNFNHMKIPEIYLSTDAIFTIIHIYIDMPNVLVKQTV